jgi:hypothetical protein
MRPTVPPIWRCGPIQHPLYHGVKGSPTLAADQRPIADRRPKLRRSRHETSRGGRSHTWAGERPGLLLPPEAVRKSGWLTGQLMAAS